MCAKSFRTNGVVSPALSAPMLCTVVDRGHRAEEPSPSVGPEDRFVPLSNKRVRPSPFPFAHRPLLPRRGRIHRISNRTSSSSSRAPSPFPRRTLVLRTCTVYCFARSHRVSRVCCDQAPEARNDPKDPPSFSLRPFPPFRSHSIGVGNSVRFHGWNPFFPFFFLPRWTDVRGHRRCGARVPSRLDAVMAPAEDEAGLKRCVEVAWDRGRERERGAR